MHVAARHSLATRESGTARTASIGSASGNRGGWALNATVKFYSGFLVAVVLVVAVSFYAGYRVGAGSHAAHRAAAAHAATAP